MEANYKIAMAAGRDAANKRMTAQGRTNWNAADYRFAARLVSKLLGSV